MSKKPDLTRLADALAAATDAHTAAKMEESAARSRETAALNALNDAQREFDEAIAELRKSGPLDSNWGRTRREVHLVEAP